jgi:hypothetical protein
MGLAVSHSVGPGASYPVPSQGILPAHHAAATRDEAQGAWDPARRAPASSGGAISPAWGRPVPVNPQRVSAARAFKN